MGDIWAITIRIMADLLVIPVVIIGAATMFRLPRSKRWKQIWHGVLAGLLGLVLAKIASLFYQGDRPFVELGTSPGAFYLNNPGFPSDHALFVFMITFVVWASTHNKKIGLLLLILSILVAGGRVLALVHTPIDVLGGAGAALLAAFIAYGKGVLPYSKSHKKA